jgi:hypothetical protein
VPLGQVAAAGDRAAAPAHFETYRRAIAEELDIDPSPAAVALRRGLLISESPTAPKPAATAAGARIYLPYLAGLADRAGGHVTIAA